MVLKVEELHALLSAGSPCSSRSCPPSCRACRSSGSACGSRWCIPCFGRLQHEQTGSKQTTAMLISASLNQPPGAWCGRRGGGEPTPEAPWRNHHHLGEAKLERSRLGSRLCRWKATSLPVCPWILFASSTRLFTAGRGSGRLVSLTKITEVVPGCQDSSHSLRIHLRRAAVGLLVRMVLAKPLEVLLLHVCERHRESIHVLKTQLWQQRTERSHGCKWCDVSFLGHSINQVGKPCRPNQLSTQTFSGQAPLLRHSWHPSFGYYCSCQLPITPKSNCACLFYKPITKANCPISLHKPTANCQLPNLTSQAKCTVPKHKPNFRVLLHYPKTQTNFSGVSSAS